MGEGKFRLFQLTSPLSYCILRYLCTTQSKIFFLNLLEVYALLLFYLNQHFLLYSPLYPLTILCLKERTYVSLKFSFLFGGVAVTCDPKILRQWWPPAHLQHTILEWQFLQESLSLHCLSDYGSEMFRKMSKLSKAKYLIENNVKDNVSNNSVNIKSPSEENLACSQAPRGVCCNGWTVDEAHGKAGQQLVDAVVFPC